MTENAQFPISAWQCAVKGGELLGYAEWVKQNLAEIESREIDEPETQPFTVTMGADIRCYVTFDGVVATDEADARKTAMMDLEAQIAFAATGWSWKPEEIQGGISIMAEPEFAEDDDVSEFVAVPDWNGPDYSTLESFVRNISRLTTAEEQFKSANGRDGRPDEIAEFEQENDLLNINYVALFNLIAAARAIFKKEG